MIILSLYTANMVQAQFGCNYHEFEGDTGVIVIDTVNHANNIWQVGRPNKSLFINGHDNPGVLVTDTVNPYPANDTSSFYIVHYVAHGFMIPHTAIISGYFKMDTDTLNDYGIIEFSPDNGNTWVDLLQEDSIYWNHAKPSLSGLTKNWTKFEFNMVHFTSQFNLDYGDTIIVRFTFISDSIVESRDGWMLDDFYFCDIAEGIEELDDNMGAFSFENPNDGNLTLHFLKDYPGIISLYTYSGQLISECSKKMEEKEIYFNGLESGLYLIVFSTEKGRQTRKLVVR